MSSWIKRQITNIAIAMTNVEKNALGQESVDLGINSEKHQRLNQTGNVVDYSFHLLMRCRMLYQ